MKDTIAEPVALSSPWLRRWLNIIAAMIFAMVVVGGATRLTNSGLSITEWKPIMGAIPPFTSADWQIAFEKYQQSSQYKLQNQGMSLSEFQFIFWWEWAHRQLGRLIGVVFIPIIILAIRGRMEKRNTWKVVGLFVLLGCQGALGWYMVASGLQNRVDVSQYRLSAHLTLATIFFAGVLWTIMGLSSRHTKPQALDQWAALGILFLVFLQIAAGGFVAGLDAGQGYNTWPLMDGHFVPNDLYTMQPAWLNIFENAMTVQFNHRILAYIILILTVWHAIRSFTLSALLLVYAVMAQACLGILTLLMHVPIGVALIHQAGALVVLTAAVWNLHLKTKMNV
jgi:heme a synthase